MNRAESRSPWLKRCYRRYLEDESPARFIVSVSQRYTIATLERLAEADGRDVRRAATLALGYLSDFRSTAVLGRRLHDADRAVRLLAEDGIHELWCRDGSESQRLGLRMIMRLNASHQWLAARRQASQMINAAPWFAEAWNQLAVAHAHMGLFSAAISDYHQALELNAYHFDAAVGMAHCHLKLDDGHAALQCFRRALKLNPGLECVRAQVAFLRRALQGD